MVSTWIAIFICFLISPTRLDPSGDEKFSTNLVRVTDVQVFSIDRISGAGNGKAGRVYLVIYFSWHPLVAKCFRYRYSQGFNDRPFTFCLLRFRKILVIFRSEKYLLWDTRTSRSNRVRSFLIILFLFLYRSFYLDTYRTSL